MYGLIKWLILGFMWDDEQFIVKGGYLKRNIIYRTYILHFGTTRDIGYTT